MDAEALRLGPHTVQLWPDNGGKYPNGNPLLVRGGSETAMIDSCVHTSPDTSDLLLVSHYHEDHVVDARRCPGEVWAHTLDAPALRSESAFASAMDVSAGEMEQVRERFRWAPVPETRSFTDGRMFDLGGGVTVTSVHLPGHTPGHCGFFVEPDGVLFMGDIDLSSFGPLYSDAGAGIAEFRASLDLCAQFDAAAYAPAHHKGPYLDRNEFLTDLTGYAQVLDRRERTILELLDAGHSTVADLVGRGVLYRPGRRPGFGDRVEASVCRKHIDDLVDRGIVRETDSAGDYALA